MTQLSVGPAAGDAERELILAAREEAAGLIEESAPALRLALDPPAMLPPRGLIPGYEIEAEIHRGAQGVVFRAAQLNTRRTVAIKILRAGPLAGAIDKSRFEREVWALRRLRHENIVSVIDSGVIDGCCYIVMDHVAGQRLDEWSARLPRPGIAESLGLFATICDAVQEAHVRGVVHRDLKPSNVLIDAGGAPHVLDFGLAKLETGELREAAALEQLTLTGQFVGSLPWASPEQAEGDLDRIDLRSDVYSLGVMLFHVLTGRYPYAVNGTLRTVLDRIVKADPLRPGALRGDVDDELDTIVLKCLTKAPPGRYQTAGELARDLRRYLAGAPIEAKRESGWYMAKKLIHRHRAVTAVALVGLGLILISLAVSITMWRAAEAAHAHAVHARLAEAQHRVQAEEQRALAEQLRDQVQAALQSEAAQRRIAEDAARNAEIAQREALQARDLERAARVSAEAQRALAIESQLQAARAAQQAQDEARQAAAVTDFLQQLLSSSDASNAGALRNALDAASKRVEAADSGIAPDVAADIREVIGETYADLGLLAQAEDSLRAAAATRLQSVADDVGEAQRGLMTEAARALRERGHADGAEGALRQLMESQDALGAEASEIAGTLTQLAGVLRDQGRTAEADAQAREALELLREADDSRPAELTAALALVGELDLDQGRLAEAEARFAEALDLRRAASGESSAFYAAGIVDMAYLRKAQGRWEEAEQLFRSAHDVLQHTRGPGSAEALQVLRALAELKRGRGAAGEAAELFQELLASLESSAPHDVRQIAAALDGLAWSQQASGDLVSATASAARALEIRSAQLGGQHPEVLSTLQALAAISYQAGDRVAAVEMMREALETQRLTLGPQNQATQRSLLGLANALRGMDRGEEVAGLYAEALAAARQSAPPDPDWLAQVLQEVAAFEEQRQEFESVEQMLREALTLRRATGPSADATAALAGFYLRRGRIEEAEACLLESIATDAPAAVQVKLLEQLELLYRGKGDETRAEETRARIETLRR